MIPASPLRYPGGKQLLSRVLARIIVTNDLEGGAYAEPYAGGAGAAISLLFSEHVSTLALNDADPCIYAMWSSILHETEQFSRLVRDTPLTPEEWRKQKSIYASHASHDNLTVGFATFFLNRTNRSGIIKNAGPIGGFEQTGKWKIDARFNRAQLVGRIGKIALYKRRISFQNLDAVDFIKTVESTPRLFIYLDPPYFAKGRELYLNHYAPDDHRDLARFMKQRTGLLWAMSYDRAPEIAQMYREFRQVPFTLSYSATTRRTGREILVLGRGLRFPRDWRKQLPASALSAEG
jgi:DNA adenine methylase